MQVCAFEGVTVVQEDSLDIVICKGERELYRKHCTKKKNKQDLLDEARYFIYIQKCKNKLRRIARREKERNKARRFCVVMAAAVLFTVAVGANGVEYTTKTVTVAPGDTLWSLWEEHGHGRADKWIAEVRDMNNMDSADIFPGDKLTLSVVIE